MSKTAMAAGYVEKFFLRSLVADVVRRFPQNLEEIRIKEWWVERISMGDEFS